jgi:CheY-like chemotaxis protein/LmbE family N-acetylglucosaminyl deacetylase
LSSDLQRNVRVLYVEDAIDQALLVKTFFSTLKGFTVSHAQDGDSALKLVGSKPWDLLVTDLNLPGADGFALIKAFRAKFRRSPILVTTGYTQAEYEEQALRAGADQVMIKPLNQADFVHRVQAMAAAGQAPEEDDTSVVLAVEGRLGDAEMGCGGTLMAEIAKGHTVVLIPICKSEDDATPEELKAASIAANILGVELRVDRTLFGDRDGQRDLLERTLNELRPQALYLPAKDDRDPSRREAALLAEEASVEVENVLAYETATTGLEFTPSRFHDIRVEMVMKMEALAAYQALGAPRVDLRPRMAQAYARYWGRFRDFAEVEAFEQVRGED